MRKILKAAASRLTVDANGTKDWYLNGKHHREDGPAIECANGTKCWYLNGKRHREDGPAIEYANGYRRWYLNDSELTEQEHAAQTKKSTTCDGEIVEIRGEKYKLTKV